MPARQRGWTRKRKTGWQACWRENGRQRTGPQLFATKTEARGWLSARLTMGLSSSRPPEVTFAEHVERYLRLHAAAVDPSTIRTLRERLGATPEDRRRRRRYQTAVEAFGHLRLSELEALSLELAEWQTTLPPRYRYAIMLSLRQVLNAAVRWKLIQENPANRAGANPQPRNPEVPFFESLASVD